MKANEILPTESLPLDITLPAEILTQEITKHLRPEDTVRFFSCSKPLKQAPGIYGNVYWKNQLQLHFPSAYQKLDVKKITNWRAEFSMHYQAEYKNISPETRKLLSIVKQGDLESFIAGNYNLEHLLQFDNAGNQVISWANINHYQVMLDYIYTLAVAYYKIPASDNDNAVSADKNDSNGNSLLHWAAYCNQSQDCITALITAGININITRTDSATPLYIAAQKGHLAVVQALIAASANVNAARRNGATPLYIAAQKCHLAVVQALIAASANVNAARRSGATPLYIAAQNGHLPVVQALIAASANINAAGTDGTTPLYIAAQNGHLAVAQALIAAIANVNAARRSGATPLYIAAQNGHLAVVQALIAAGANVNAALPSGTTPLYIAAQNGHLAVVQALIAAGANVNAAGPDNKTPFDVAKEKGLSEILKALAYPKLLNYITQRGADAAPEYKATLSIHIHTLNFGFSKQEKVAAAHMLKAVLDGDKDPTALTPHINALENGELKEIYRALKSDISNNTHSIVMKMPKQAMFLF